MSRLLRGRVLAGGQLRHQLPPSHGLVSAPIGQAVHRLLLIQAFRPDRLLAMAHVFVSTNLGESFMSIMEQPLDLTHIVDTEVGLVAGLSSLHTGHTVCWTPWLNPDFIRR